MLHTLLRSVPCCLLAAACASTAPPASELEHSHGDGQRHEHGHAAAETMESQLVAATPDSPAYLKLGPGVEVIDDLAAAVRADSSTFTHEGYFAPLLLGNDLRAFTLRLEPGMFLAEHPHATESMVFTVSGRWVLCSGGNRKVMEAGSLFHFGPEAPTGWEAPFAEGAQVLIVKTLREGEDYAMFCDGMRELARKLDARYAEGEVFYFHQLEEDHPAIAFARKQGAPIDSVRAERR